MKFTELVSELPDVTNENIAEVKDFMVAFEDRRGKTIAHSCTIRYDYVSYRIVFELDTE